MCFINTLLFHIHWHQKCQGPISAEFPNWVHTVSIFYTNLRLKSYMRKLIGLFQLTDALCAGTVERKTGVMNPKWYVTKIHHTGKSLKMSVTLWESLIFWNWIRNTVLSIIHYIWNPMGFTISLYIKCWVWSHFFVCQQRINSIYINFRLTLLIRL